jgi:hypothetical protein
MKKSPAPSFHEDLSRADAGARPTSDRSFGFVFAGFFALLFAIGVWRGHLRLWPLAVSAAFLLAALAFPRVLAPLNAVWAKLGELLHRVTSPIILGLIYYLAIVPVGLLMRAAGKDPLRRRFDAGASSYWILREPPGPPPETMHQQF